MNHVVIIGFMGSGKTRVGKQLSKDLGLPFVDLEKIITKRMNLSAREIFERFGEPYYRALETLALKQLIQDSERKVISLGAGLPLQEQNEKVSQRTWYSCLSERITGNAQETSGGIQKRSDAGWGRQR